MEFTTGVEIDLSNPPAAIRVEYGDSSVRQEDICPTHFRAFLFQEVAGQGLISLDALLEITRRLGKAASVVHPDRFYFRYQPVQKLTPAGEGSTCYACRR
ncbi:hypothetical protein HYW30_01735 [Candidatus Azambacteria bacterium]|nr:hypothetical protein [Candidatus Azambacteria bacterium]MBI2587999.1 hypothetical protein [Candidatus Azambacteria bacterium]